MLKQIIIALMIMCLVIIVSAESYNAGRSSNLRVIDYLHEEINVITDEYEYKLDVLHQELLTCVKDEPTFGQPPTGWEFIIPSFHTKEPLRM